MPYTDGGFVEQPAWFIATSLAYLSGKARAEDALQKKANQKS